MNELILYITELLNIKTDSKIVVLEIEKELKTIEDMALYQRYINKHFDNEELRYKTGFQKFLELTKKYKAGVIELKAKPQLTEAKSKAKLLAEKVNSTSVQFDKSEWQRNHLGYTHKELNFKSFKLDKKPYFTKEEIGILNTIGTLKKCLALQRMSSSEDLLEKNIEQILRSRALKSVSPMLHDKTDARVLGMIGKVGGVA